MGVSGESRWLLELIEEHPAPLAYDLRHRFGISIEDVGESVSPKEAMWLVDELLTDPSSHLAAAVLKWDYPVSKEWIILVDHLDLVASANKKNKPIPRPWKTKDQVGSTDLSPIDARAVLARNAGRG